MNSSVPRTPEAYRLWWAENTDVPYGECWCGCGEETPLATKHQPGKYVKGEPRRYINGHHHHLSPVAYIVDDETGCWVWQRAKDEKGYGLLRAENMTQRAYVVYHRAAHGEIPPKMERHHRCENRACVNPDHIEVVTHTDNMRLARNTKLNIEAAREIRRRFADGEPRQALADEFGVSKDMVNKLLRGAFWKE